jgi:hypothetical protein
MVMVINSGAINANPNIQGIDIKAVTSNNLQKILSLSPSPALDITGCITFSMAS